MSDIKIAPSVLAANYTKLGEEIIAIDKAGADYIHLDIMDGHFVPNISFGPDVVKALRPLTKKVFDVHLMIAPVDPYIKAFAEAGADIISFHPEAGAHTHRTLQTIKAEGCKAGLVLNPATPIGVIEPVLDMLDLILVMSVNPGFGGQSFIDSQLGKISDLREIIDGAGRHIDLEVDGGINFQTAPQAIAAGANVLVAGTATFKGGPENYATNIATMRGDT